MTIEPVAPETFTPGRFDRQVVLVTGSGGGMGLACAQRAAREGASVVLCDINGDAVRKAADHIVAAGGRALGICADITRREDCAAMVMAAVDAFGGIDVAINAAGVMDGGRDGQPAPIHLASDTYLRRTMEINVFGTMFACAAETARMVEQGRGGAIVNVGSTTGLTGSAGTPAYVASKHAINGLTRAMAIDYAPFGIRCNSVNMGPTDTPMLERAMAFLSGHAAPAGTDGPRPAVKPRAAIARLSTPWEQAAVILFAASREASYLTGALIANDGGWTAY
ncbi:SDR family NAD(P)-dependent oxidoreductase [Zhengella sp. ZM62]|uniref:SDR family NAD(P)-dependent oxidoreductase n=1 Tax=Zhengella sedimenti TaxID=3390035 RepID=UPI00397526B1